MFGMELTALVRPRASSAEEMVALATSKQQTAMASM
jgi:hypothetical protein